MSIHCPRTFSLVAYLKRFPAFSLLVICPIFNPTWYPHNFCPMCTFHSIHICSKWRGSKSEFRVSENFLRFSSLFSVARVPLKHPEMYTWKLNLALVRKFLNFLGFLVWLECLKTTQKMYTWKFNLMLARFFFDFLGFLVWLECPKTTKIFTSGKKTHASENARTP